MFQARSGLGLATLPTTATTTPTLMASSNTPAPMPATRSRWPRGDKTAVGDTSYSPKSAVLDAHPEDGSIRKAATPVGASAANKPEMEPAETHCGQPVLC